MRVRALILIVFMTYAMGGCEQSAAPPGAGAGAGAKLSGNAPAFFARKTFDNAKAQAKAEGKLLIVDATASWCGPCKKMDKTTWIDEKVVAWMNDHGVAVQVDVDEQKPLAQALKITAMPTVILFKDGQELDRSIGYQTPQELLKWLNGALKST